MTLDLGLPLKVKEQQLLYRMEAPEGEGYDKMNSKNVKKHLFHFNDFVFVLIDFWSADNLTSLRWSAFRITQLTVETVGAIKLLQLIAHLVRVDNYEDLPQDLVLQGPDQLVCRLVIVA